MLLLNVCGQKLERLDNDTIASDAISYPHCLFTFHGDWTQGKKTAIFANSEWAYNVDIAEDGSCIVPAEVLKGECFKLSVYNIEDKRRITTNQIIIPIEYSGYTEDGLLPEEQVVSIHAEMYKRMDAIEEKIKNIGVITSQEVEAMIYFDKVYEEVTT